MLPGRITRRGVAMAMAATAALGTQPAAAASTPNATSIFVSPDQDLAFAVSVPSDSGATDLYFTLAVQESFSWGAVGLGSDKMAGTLVLMVYGNAAGTNVTFSPRLAKGNAEPAYYPGLQVDALPGTGAVNGTYVFSGRCRNCRTWPNSKNNGSIDVTRADQPCIFALGPPGNQASDDPAAPLRYHVAYGAFSLDLRAASATGVASAPALNEADTQASSGGAKLLSSEGGKQDWAAVFHAVVMVFCFVALMPLGVLILRVGEWVRWHAVNQGLALVGVIVGAGLGIFISTRYVRSASFNTAHQIIGLVVAAAMIAQFLLGFFHHRAYKRTLQPTRLAPAHVWLGRVVIPLGVIDAFLGFPLAQASHYNYVLAGLVIAVAGVVLFMLLFKGLFRRLRGSTARSPGFNPPRPANPPRSPGGYNPEPWRVAPSPDPYGGGGRGAEYAPPPAGEIGLTTLSYGPSQKGAEARGTRGNNLGSEQMPREYV